MRGTLAIEDKVKELVCIIRVGSLRRDKAGINPEAKPLLGEYHLEVGILVEGGNDLGGKHVTDRRFTRKHEVIGGIVIKGADIGFQGEQLLLCLIEYGGVGFVQAFSKGFEGQADNIPGIVHHHDRICKGGVPEVLKALDLEIDHIGIIDQQRNPGCIWDGILVFRVIELALEGRVDVAEVGDFGLVQLGEQILSAGDVDDVVAGKDKVIFTACLEFHKHLLIAGEIAVIDFDAGLLGEFREDVVREVGRPGEDIEDLFLSSLCGPGIIGEDDAGRTVRTADDLAGRSGIPVATRCRCQRARRQQSCKNALDLFHSSLLFYFVRLDWYMENVLFFSCKKRTKKIRFSG